MSPPRDDEPPSEADDGPVDGGTGSGRTDDAEAGAEPDPPAGSDGGSGQDRGPGSDDARSTGDVEEPGVDEGGTDETGDSGEGADDDAGEGPTGDDAGIAVNGGAPAADAPSVDAPSSDGPPARRGDAGAAESETGSGARTFVVDVVSSALAVLLVGALLFAVSGVWPPMVAIESPSMTPHMQTGDLVFVMEEERFPGDGAVAGTGVVTLRSGQETGYEKFQRPGDVIVYKPDGSESATPIIHRAMFYVEEGENWYDEADRQSIGRYSECGETTEEALPTCPAPHAGFITKGDANGGYDQAQANPLSGPVKPEWVVGTAEVRVPKLGCIRLRSERCAPGLRAATTDAGLTADATFAAETGNRTAVAP
ncbi:S26 family signal peptidase [Halosimplex marinum]|uniref:S26 family signal peptidase n=1 Tax=Halosimplex marinum TaxID=3396620 RepID=UPI003F5480EA